MAAGRLVEGAAAPRRSLTAARRCEAEAYAFPAELQPCGRGVEFSLPLAGVRRRRTPSQRNFDPAGGEWSVVCRWLSDQRDCRSKLKSHCRLPVRGGGVRLSSGTSTLRAGSGVWCAAGRLVEGFATPSRSLTAARRCEAEAYAFPAELRPCGRGVECGVPLVV
ncbi:hypothetical protein RHS04_09004 [Rhizoctonia solani]|uniref:Uncharacterized protein n=1 Tax=Rhizoctonia solani TaxID=456999 RepID=A0A8H7H0I7_9AGAM|nr:hypothetical protein RHS04_09004 [Rhizoctonia solani]